MLIVVIRFCGDRRGACQSWLSCFLLAVACSKKEAPPPPPPEVQVAAVVQKDVPIYIELVGATLGSEDVEIRARVESYLASVNFTEGSFIKKGQLLYKIDTQLFQAALNQAQANLSTARARLDKTNNVVVDTAEVFSVRGGGVYQGKECDCNSPAVYGPGEEFHGAKLLGEGVLGIDGGAGRGRDTAVHPRAGERG